MNPDLGKLGILAVFTAGDAVALAIFAPHIAGGLGIILLLAMGIALVCAIVCFARALFIVIMEGLAAGIARLAKACPKIFACSFGGISLLFVLALAGYILVIILSYVPHLSIGPQWFGFYTKWLIIGGVGLMLFALLLQAGETELSVRSHEAERAARSAAESEAARERALDSRLASEEREVRRYGADRAAQLLAQREAPLLAALLHQDHRRPC